MAYIKPFNRPIGYNRGAPMGRYNELGPEYLKSRQDFYNSVHFHCVKVNLNTRGYDKGGAHWGHVIERDHLYCIYAYLHIDGTPWNYEAYFFTRAKNREEAKQDAKKYFGNSITFYR